MLGSELFLCSKIKEGGVIRVMNKSKIEKQKHLR
jgi:hypothetical protein